MRKATMSISQAAKEIGISRQATWLAIQSGKLKARKHELGFLSVWRITVEEAKRFKYAREIKKL